MINMNRWLTIFACSTGIVSNGTFVWLMYKSTILGNTVMMNMQTAPYKEQYIEIPMAIIGAIILLIIMIKETIK
jgi:TRAP-type C4-dicarboxylate transport system permease small subunit